MGALKGLVGVGVCYLLAYLLPYLLDHPTLGADDTANPLLRTADRRFRPEGSSRGNHRVTRSRLALNLLNDLAHELTRVLHLRVGAREHHRLRARGLVGGVRVNVNVTARACADILDYAASLANNASHGLDGDHFGHLRPVRATHGRGVASGRHCVASLLRRRVSARSTESVPCRSWVAGRGVQTVVDQRLGSLDLIREALDRDWLAVGTGLTFVLDVDARLCNIDSGDGDESSAQVGPEPRIPSREFDLGVHAPERSRAILILLPCGPITRLIWERGTSILSRWHPGGSGASLPGPPPLGAPAFIASLICDKGVKTATSDTCASVHAKRRSQIADRRSRRSPGWLPVVLILLGPRS